MISEQSAKVVKNNLTDKSMHVSGNDENNAGNNVWNTGNETGRTNAKVSFRDKLIGDSTIKVLAFADSLTGEKVASIDSKTDDDIPVVSFTDEAREAFNEPYKNVVIIKVLEKH
ncbi:hypothetical protein PIB30_072856, partial [Stylosanthes scabra]|nr:hypothetical protein [Stylosanthes scabra]